MRRLLQSILTWLVCLCLGLSSLSLAEEEKQQPNSASPKELAQALEEKLPEGWSLHFHFLLNTLTLRREEKVVMVNPGGSHPNLENEDIAKAMAENGQKSTYEIILNFTPLLTAEEYAAQKKIIEDTLSKLTQTLEQQELDGKSVWWQVDQERRKIQLPTYYNQAHSVYRHRSDPDGFLLFPKEAEQERDQILQQIAEHLSYYGEQLFLQELHPEKLDVFGEIEE